MYSVSGLRRELRSFEQMLTTSKVILNKLGLRTVAEDLIKECLFSILGKSPNKTHFKLSEYANWLKLTQLRQLIQHKISKFFYLQHVKGRNQLETRGVSKMTNDWNMLGNVVINVLLSFNFATILYKIYFRFRFPTADWIGNSLPNRQCAANISIV